MRTLPSTISKPLLKWARPIVTVGVGYLVLLAILFTFQQSIIYFPQPAALAGLAAKVTLPVAEAVVVATTRPHSGQDAIVYFGGNAEDVSLSLFKFSAAFPDHAIYLLNYRGYGGRSGKPTEKALVADALALFDMAHALHPHVAVIGRSFGSGIAVQVASQRPVARLALVTPYDSLEGVAAGRVPYAPISWLMLDKYESWRYAPSIAAPTLILVADHDEVIPRASTDLLHSRFKEGGGKFQGNCRRGAQLHLR